MAPDAALIGDYLLGLEEASKRGLDLNHEVAMSWADFNATCRRAKDSRRERDVNVVGINGRLTANVELRHSKAGNAVANFSIAVNSREKDGDEWVDYASFFDVVAFGKTAERLASHMEKGCMVGVSGALKQERWEKDGQKRSKVVLIARDIEFLTWPEGRDKGSSPKGRKEVDDEYGY